VRTVNRAGDDLRAVVEVAAEQQAEKIVVGLPLNMDGSSGPVADAVGVFRDRLLTEVSVPVELWDERLTTKSAEDVLIEAGTRRKRRKEVVDKLAAQIMLQHYLDAKGEGGLEEWNDGTLE
jgi:putative Holliday junction resolvase